MVFLIGPLHFDTLYNIFILSVILTNYSDIVNTTGNYEWISMIQICQQTLSLYLLLFPLSGEASVTTAKFFHPFPTFFR